MPKPATIHDLGGMTTAEIKLMFAEASKELGKQLESALAPIRESQDRQERKLASVAGDEYQIGTQKRIEQKIDEVIQRQEVADRMGDERHSKNEQRLAAIETELQTHRVNHPIIIKIVRWCVSFKELWVALIGAGTIVAGYSALQQWLKSRGK